jgi:uncharacterized membrane protein YpjA
VPARRGGHGGPLALAASLKGIPRHPRWLVFLTAVNLGGFLYGMEWYRSQLATVPFWAWPVTADCPVSALLFAGVTACLTLGRRCEPLEGIAFVAALKYGLWTVVVLAQSWLAGAAIDLDGFNLMWTHVGMAGEALLFGAVRPPRLPWVGLGAAWAAFNSLLDYGFGFHPTLPSETPVSFALAMSVGLGALAVGVFAWLAARSRASAGAGRDPLAPRAGSEDAEGGREREGAISWHSGACWG